MKTKFLIPVLALIFATGMSFTTVELGNEQAMDYFRNGGTWVPIPEINCGVVGANNCQVRLPDGSIHDIYDLQDFNSLKKTTRTTPVEL
ncbi:DUF6520 family protein [Mesonia maritima]|uniref:TMhelix containing protein n=1 Tax=Mesonia maritima TaxID=1793873 RepID=A0ABU1K874_9FLAO|nr:DUF6520 family protein [Mesonia maritima]MDR6301809.1 hypothetical protein [Mesonia maritima]